MSTGVPTILMTGGSGRIGSMLRTRLARPGRTLRLLDVVPPPAAAYVPALLPVVLLVPLALVVWFASARFGPRPGWPRHRATRTGGYLRLRLPPVFR